MDRKRCGSRRRRLKIIADMSSHCSAGYQHAIYADALRQHIVLTCAAPSGSRLGAGLEQGIRHTLLAVCESSATPSAPRVAKVVACEMGNRLSREQDSLKGICESPCNTRLCLDALVEQSAVVRQEADVCVRNWRERRQQSVDADGTETYLSGCRARADPRSVRSIPTAPR